MMPDKISLRKKIGLELFRKYRHNAALIHQLKFILWECTMRCNLNCLHCGSDCTSIKNAPDMSIADFLRAIDQISPQLKPNETTIIFTGGEVLMRSDIEICGEELYKRGFPWGIVTNGFLLDENRLHSLLNCGLQGVTISLDGFSDEHNWLRGNPKSFEKASNAIDLLTQLPNFTFDVVTVANQRNYSHLEEFKNFLIKKGVKNWRIFTVFPIGRAKDNPELQMNKQQFRGIFDFILKTREEKEILLSYGCEGFLGNYETKVRDRFFFCHSGIHTASILADGSITGCPNQRKHFIQGNISTENFAEIWEKRFELFRNREWTKTGICKDCDNFRYCEGNGMHLRNPIEGTLDFCHLHRIKGD